MALFAFFVFLPWAPPLGESLPLDSRCVPVAALAEFLLVALAWLDGDPPSAFSPWRRPGCAPGPRPPW